MWARIRKMNWYARLSTMLLPITNTGTWFSTVGVPSTGRKQAWVRWLSLQHWFRTSSGSWGGICSACADLPWVEGMSCPSGRGIWRPLFGGIGVEVELIGDLGRYYFVDGSKLRLASTHVKRWLLSSIQFLCLNLQHSLRPLRRCSCEVFISKETQFIDVGACMIDWKVCGYWAFVQYIIHLTLLFLQPTGQAQGDQPMETSLWQF